ncbi:uncharacterized protein NDAI_0E02830 [Naumovozyma dairenensis CBS 421]|uniref:Uncharacterized protein n=1 Tax=Naumovozyma dairenensis (strain ATCC 10597 / BCRC 20456 / CBS 421 / NBRC 0211 / NRRL Y-12639) TaxID=1071378 RepID=G0WBI0_NAUDC|nr:hypothetical protein NDAI_0E02830 [Naumovozyma dairenensis CBS 421]CCD25100.1 hypothetical protein NDAI_0E02830 [Naumovozyma dairenensis CBS 421]
MNNQYGLKRCRSNELYGNLDISHYKKQKLIQDLQNLSLQDNTASASITTRTSTSFPHRIKDFKILPNSITFKPINLLTSISSSVDRKKKNFKNRPTRDKHEDDKDRDLSLYDSNYYIYSKILNDQNINSSQLIKWIDLSKFLYFIWYNWYYNLPKENITILIMMILIWTNNPFMKILIWISIRI